jgi:diketogulonate reductase-like aldo/keto reductase
MTNSAPATNESTKILADGHLIPLIGLGVWQIPDGTKCVRAVNWALEAGYRHIDTAQAYGNEQSVGRAIRESGIPRNQVFITTKFYPARKDPAAELERSLERLATDYVDLYIIHWPRAGATWAWPGMELARSKGHARSIGVSNFSAAELDELIRIATTPPVINQVQFSPFEYRKALYEDAQTRGVAIEAYSPLGTGRHLRNKVVRDVAQRNERTPAQVLLRWAIQRDTIVLPKSTHQERIEENLRIFDFTLSAHDLDELDALDRSGGTDEARERKWW